MRTVARCGRLLLVAAQTESLHDARVRFAALAELLERQPIVVVLVHLVEDLVDALLRCVLVLRLRLLALCVRGGFMGEILV